MEAVATPPDMWTGTFEAAVGHSPSQECGLWLADPRLRQRLMRQQSTLLKQMDLPSMRLPRQPHVPSCKDGPTASRSNANYHLNGAQAACGLWNALGSGELAGAPKGSSHARMPLGPAGIPFEFQAQLETMRLARMSSRAVDLGVGATGVDTRVFGPRHDLLLSEMEDAWGRDEGWLSAPDAAGEGDDPSITTQEDHESELQDRDPFEDLRECRRTWASTGAGEGGFGEKGGGEASQEWREDSLGGGGGGPGVPDACSGLDDGERKEPEAFAQGGELSGCVQGALAGGQKTTDNVHIQSSGRGDLGDCGVSRCGNPEEYVLYRRGSCPMRHVRLGTRMQQEAGRAFSDGSGQARKRSGDPLTNAEAPEAAKEGHQEWKASSQKRSRPAALCAEVELMPHVRVELPEFYPKRASLFGQDAGCLEWQWDHGRPANTTPCPPKAHLDAMVDTFRAQSFAPGSPCLPIPRIFRAADE